MQKWEQDLEISLEVEVWSKMVQCAFRSYINTSLIEAYYKVLMRWYMVPVRVATYVPGASPQWFRGCGMDGTMFHIWWTCPKVRKFWIRTYKFIYSLTQVNLIKSPLQALLGCPVEGTSKHIRRLIAFIFIASRISIAKSWKSSTIPFHLLKYKLSWIMVNERLSAILNKVALFDKIWDPWINYLLAALWDSIDSGVFLSGARVHPPSLPSILSSLFPFSLPSIWICNLMGPRTNWDYTEVKLVGWIE